MIDWIQDFPSETGETRLIKRPRLRPGFDQVVRFSFYYHRGRFHVHHFPSFSRPKLYLKLPSRLSLTVNFLLTLFLRNSYSNSRLELVTYLWSRLIYSLKSQGLCGYSSRVWLDRKNRYIVLLGVHLTPSSEEVQLQRLSEYKVCVSFVQNRTCTIRPPNSTHQKVS